MLDYACSSNFYNIDMYPRDFSENFPNLVDYSTVDLDIHLDPMPSFDNSLKERSSLCKQFNVDTRPGHLFISFSSILVRMYINYVMEALCDLHVTLKDEEKLVGYIYEYAAQNLMDFWDWNVFFFHGSFKNFPCRFKETVCFRIR